MAARRVVAPPGERRAELFRAACKAEYDFERGEAITQLLYAEWVDREAARRGMNLSQAQIEKTYGVQMRRDRKQAAHDQLLIRGGATQGDLRMRVRLNELLTRLQHDTPVSDAEIAAYFRAAPQEEFFLPERRRLRIVLTRGKAAAARARRALLAGESWFAVSRRYSTGDGADIGDATVPMMDGSFTHQGVTSDKRFRTAAFRAPARRVAGPVEGQLGWYVFTVDKVLPAVPAKLERFADHIRGVLASRKLDLTLRRHYGRMTRCAKEYRTPSAPPCVIGTEPQ